MGRTEIDIMISSSGRVACALGGGSCAGWFVRFESLARGVVRARGDEAVGVVQARAPRVEDQTFRQFSFGRPSQSLRASTPREFVGTR